MIKEIRARVLLSSAKQPDPWFGIQHTMNLYRGCSHQCIYCDSRSQCYQIENFADVLVKVNAIELLRKELPRKRIKGTIGTGSMSDPYQLLEAERRLTRQALEVIAEHQYPVHIITKSDLVLRDLDLLQEIGKVYAAVSFTVTAADDTLSKQVEPGAPPSSRRLTAMKSLAEKGVLTGMTMMPILPFIEDTVENIRDLVERAHASGATYILPAFGMTLREGSRDYYYAQLDRRLPGLKEKYEKRFGLRYDCSSPKARQLQRVFQEACARYGIATRMPIFTPKPAQMELW